MSTQKSDVSPPTDLFPPHRFAGRPHRGLCPLGQGARQDLRPRRACRAPRHVPQQRAEDRGAQRRSVVFHHGRQRVRRPVRARVAARTLAQAAHAPLTLRARRTRPRPTSSQSFRPPPPSDRTFEEFSKLFGLDGPSAVRSRCACGFERTACVDEALCRNARVARETEGSAVHRRAEGRGVPLLGGPLAARVSCSPLFFPL